MDRGAEAPMHQEDVHGFGSSAGLLTAIRIQGARLQVIEV